jgi:hypothetical protein
MLAGPLDDARLKSIEDCLNAGRFDDAQRGLAALASVQGLGPGLAYLSARLLFHRGRLDAASVAARLREVLEERPEFIEAKQWLETVERSQAVTEPPPPYAMTRPPAAQLVTRPAPAPAQAVTQPPARLETPRIPATLRPLVAAPRTSLGELELPRSEMPTDPAPPPDAESGAAPLSLEKVGASLGPWDPLELALAGGKREAVLSGLDKLAARDLDALLGQKKPRFAELAGEVSSFLSRAPIARYFAPFDLTLDSIDRIDAIVALLVPPGISKGYYALRVSLSTYLGECVRQAAGGSWEGTLAEPEIATVKRSAGPYVPWTELAEALGAGASLRDGAGPPPHPAAEPPEETVTVVSETKAPWHPRRWPTLAETQELTRALASSPLGVWAARCQKIPLDRTPASLRALDRYAVLLNPRGKNPGTADDWVRHAAVLTGGYLGELLCLHAGGKFSENDVAPEGPLRFEVVMPDGSAAYPLLFAYERLGGKKPGTFVKFFDDRLKR